jgi:hypothetical protein
VETREREITGSARFPIIVALCALLHNLIYYFFYLRLTEIDFVQFFLRYGAATALYTTVLSAIPPLLISSRRRD